MDESKLDTEQLAKITHVRPGTIRRSLCVKGHFFGMKPVKLPNGRLLWPADLAIKLVNGEVVER